MKKLLIILIAIIALCPQSVRADEPFKGYATVYSLEGKTKLNTDTRYGICATGNKELLGKYVVIFQRLPEDFDTYLITLESGDVCKCEFNPDFIDEEHENGAFTYYHQYFDQATLGMIDEEEEAVDAIAWMPFEPYKTESEK